MPNSPAHFQFEDLDLKVEYSLVEGHAVISPHRSVYELVVEPFICIVSRKKVC